MKFDIKDPTKTDIFPYEKEDTYYQHWLPSKEKGSHYVWVQRVSENVELKESEKIVLGHGVTFYVYKGISKQEILYRVCFGGKKPTRFLCEPFPYIVFWSFGKKGGASENVKYLFKDKYVSVHKWVDKNSFCAIIRQRNTNKNSLC